MHQSGSQSSFSLFMLWFGAAVSVAEILTGGYLADLGLSRGLAAIILGHLAGMVPLLLAGYVGFRERVPAVASTRFSFGARGSWLVSALNVLQLIGWTAVMVQVGGQAMNGLLKSLWGVEAPLASPVLLGLLVGLWSCLELKGKSLLNTISVALLFCLTVVLSAVVLRQPATAAPAATGSFGSGFELSVIMPLSWLPLIADYTSKARSRTGAWLAPFAGYFLGSCWMYAIGLLGALHTGSADPTGMMLGAGLGAVALVVVFLATVTTTFMDVFSASVSLANIFPKVSRQAASAVFAGLGTILAVAVSSDLYIDFLYLLGSVFAPVAAVFLTDYYLLRTDSRGRVLDPVALVSLVAGVGLYQVLLSRNIPIGPTVTSMIGTALLHLILRTLTRNWGRTRVETAGSRPA